MIGNMLGPYEILEELGHGGMATVYRAYQKSMDRFVAIKVIHNAIKLDKTGLERFSREARLVARLEHAHILPVYDFDGEHDPPYIVMRYLPAGTLEDIIKNETLTLDRVIHIFSQIGAALDYAHSQGVVHRDIKPSNIMVDDAGNAFLTDFGIARMVEGGLSLTTTGMAVGTPGYMAPEQVMENKVDGRADVYALGVILYEILAGTSPFSAETPMGIAFKHVHEPVPSVLKYNPDIPPAMEAVVWQALAKNPEARFQTAGEMVHAMVQATGEDTGLRTRQFDNTPLNESVVSTAGTGVRETVSPTFLRGYGLWIATLLAILAVGAFLLLPDDDDVDSGLSSVDKTRTQQAVIALQQTETATYAVTPTDTDTDTPTETYTPTDTLTQTPTDTPTNTPTNTPTPTLTPTTRPITLVPDEVGFGWILDDNGNRLEGSRLSIQEGNTLSVSDEQNLLGFIDGGENAENPAVLSLWSASEVEFDRYEATYLEFVMGEDSRVFIQTGQYALQGVTLVHSLAIEFSSQGTCMHAQYIEENIVEFACYTGDGCVFTLERNEDMELPGYYVVQIDFQEEELVDDPRAISVAEAVELNQQLETRFNRSDVGCLQPLLPDDADSGQSLVSTTSTSQSDHPEPSPTRQRTATRTATTSSIQSITPTNTNRPRTLPPTSTPTQSTLPLPTSTLVPTVIILPTNTYPPTATRVPPTATRRPTATQPAILTAVPTLVPDSDGDGITDSLDNCPNEAGPLTNGGCPLPDNDSDGIPNILDNCPNKPGPTSNGGCPLPTPDTNSGSLSTLLPRSD